VNTSRTCPSCGRSLAPDAPQGLCPECLLKAGFPSGTQPAPGETGPVNRGFRPPAPAELAPLFPQLEIVECIGLGGMGAVYKALQPSLDRLVALKILPPRAGADPGFAERFTREARALAKLNHPHIVAVHDFGLSGSFHYLVMEFVDGANLRQLLSTAKMTPQEALAIVPQICDALQFAHDQGIVHRDIKPENILLSKAGVVKIADFGLAKLVGTAALDAPITAASDVMGTPHYMAPEQVERPQSVDHRADIYSLGVVFYQMLTGELPLGRFRPPSDKVQIDVRLDEVVLRALANEPELRYQQASALKTEVESIASTEPVDRLANVRADGRLLVLPVKGSRFPLRCVLTNKPVAESELRTKTFYWVPPVVWLSLLLTPLVFIILYVLFRRKVRTEIPLSAKGRREGWNRMLRVIALFLVGVILASLLEHSLLAAALGVVLILASAVYFLIKIPVLWLAKVEEGEAWLAGASPKFLATLAPYQPSGIREGFGHAGLIWWKSVGIAVGALVIALLAATSYWVIRHSDREMARVATINGKLTINVAPDGTITAAGQKVTLTELTAIAAEEARRDKDAEVVVVAGEGSPIRAVEEVMNTLRKVGIHRFSLRPGGPPTLSPSSPAGIHPESPSSAERSR
jgi:biopolymer transport protein ExbD